MLQNTQLYQSDKTGFDHIYHRLAQITLPNFTIVSDRSRPYNCRFSLAVPWYT